MAHGPREVRVPDVVVAVIGVVLLAAAAGGITLLRLPAQELGRTVGGVAAVEVRLGAGRVEIGEYDRDDVRCDLTVRRRVGHARPTVSLAGGTVLRIDGRAGEARVRLRLPRGTRVRAEVRTGEITLWGSAGALVLVTGTGTIAGRELTGAVAARSGAGDVNLHFTSPPRRVAASSDTGLVTVVLPDGRYAVETETGDPGAAEVDVPHDPDAEAMIRARSRAGRVRVRLATPGPVRI
jgi:hypothetical protein